MKTEYEQTPLAYYMSASPTKQTEILYMALIHMEENKALSSYECINYAAEKIMSFSKNK